MTTTKFTQEEIAPEETIPMVRVLTESDRERLERHGQRFFSHVADRFPAQAALKVEVLFGNGKARIRLRVYPSGSPEGEGVYLPTIRVAGITPSNTTRFQINNYVGGSTEAAAAFIAAVEDGAELV